jgi:hypothetical protein
MAAPSVARVLGQALSWPKRGQPVEGNTTRIIIIIVACSCVVRGDSMQLNPDE